MTWKPDAAPQPMHHASPLDLCPAGHRWNSDSSTTTTEQIDSHNHICSFADITTCHPHMCPTLYCTMHRPPGGRCHLSRSSLRGSQEIPNGRCNCLAWLPVRLAVSLSHYGCHKQVLPMGSPLAWARALAASAPRSIATMWTTIKTVLAWHYSV